MLRVSLFLVTIFCLGIGFLGSVASAESESWFGNFPPLGPHDKLRQLLAPYDLIELNYLGANYGENMLDKRTNIASFTHLLSDSNCSDAWQLPFPDDTARFIQALVFEDRYSPVVRLELVRRLTKGLIGAHIPGTRAYHSFRHRHGGKTFLIFDGKKGRLLLSKWGDMVEGHVSVGFRAKISGNWYEVTEFSYSDEPPGAGTPAVARSPRYWNESPFVFKRHYRNEDDKEVSFRGRYWFSDEDKPLEFKLSSDDAEYLDIVIGEPGRPMSLLREARAPGIIHLPDRKTTFNSETEGTKIFESPSFNYFILRKETAWASPGYSTALLVMWEGQPLRIKALEENGYGEIRITFSRKDGKTEGRVWLLPFMWLNHLDMHYVFLNAESFLKTGRLMHGGFPTQQLLNAIPAGLAAGAYLLTRYNEPFVHTARIHAQRAVEVIIDGERHNQRMVREYHKIRAMAWMVKLGRLMNDEEMVARYTPWLEKLTERMISPEGGFDGEAWPDGWTHLYSMQALWMAYEASGNEEYRKAFQRALKVYTIDPEGIYRHDEPLKAPAGFDTYAGTLPLAVWGHQGKMDKVNMLINLDVPGGWCHPELPVKYWWNDAGAGPWAQVDANPYFMGFSLRGLEIPRDRKYVLPLGSFPRYDEKGRVTITNTPIVDNPFFPRAQDELRVIFPGEDKKIEPEISVINFIPGSESESKHILEEGGRIIGKKRLLRNTDSVVYNFNVAGYTNISIDIDIQGRNGYRVEVSPDGKNWHEELNSWSDKITRRSMDVSFLTGCRDELVRMAVITPPNDKEFIVEESKTTVLREYSRYVEGGGYFIYKLELPQVVECHLEFIVGNSYRLQVSRDGISWYEGLSASQKKLREGKNFEDAAWIRFLDVTEYLNDSGNIFVKFTNLKNKVSPPNNRGAFLRRLTIYSIFDSENIYVRISPVAIPEGVEGEGVTLEKISLRKWRR